MPNQFIEIPNWNSQENQGAGVAIAELSGLGIKDLVVFQIDNPANLNQGLYKIGRNLDAKVAVLGDWTGWQTVPNWDSFENQGGDIAIADLTGDGKQDLIVFQIDSPPGLNRGRYKIGRNIDANGVVLGGWTPNWIEIPDWNSWENQDGGITVADVTGNGKPDLIIFQIDNPPGLNQGRYKIGFDLDPVSFIANNWTDWVVVPGWFSWENQGAGIAVADLEGTGALDLIVFQIDNAMQINGSSGQNQAFYKIGKNIGANGAIDPKNWGTWLGAPNWFSWENQGGSIAVTQLGGRQKLVAFMVDNPPDQNAGLYEVVNLDHDPAEQGKWELLPFKSGVLAVHAALLPTGKVLFFAGSGSSQKRFDSPIFGDESQKVYTSVVWDPTVASGPGSPNFSHPPTIRDGTGRPFDFFCGGDSFLSDGRLLSGGGTLAYDPFKGRPDVTVFDPKTESWSFVKKMAHGRWYPTLITLGDGRILATTGLNEDGNDNKLSLEIYSENTDTWQFLNFAGGFPGLPLYAHLFLLQDGKIFFSGGRMDDALEVDPCIFDLNTNPVQTKPVQDLVDPELRNQSASVLLPPAQAQKVMVMGGGPDGKPDKTYATDKVSIVDLKAANPDYVAAAPMQLPRMHLNSVLLPDRTVFVSGGSLTQESQPLARLQAELYDPETDTWHLMATAQVPRLYHSTALLLPDGRVVAAGSNPEAGKSVVWEQDPPDPEEEMRLEIFSPPYLFKGARPAIANAPTEWKYGQTVAIQSPQAGDSLWASLIRNGVTTHSFDSDQRLVDLPIISQVGGVVRVTVTNNPNLAPPGWYMLFLTDNNRIPSVAKWIHLT
jgi:hypothetical protein